MLSEIGFLRTIIDSLEEGITIQNADGQTIECNRQALSILELTHEEMMGSTSRDPLWAPLTVSGNPMPYEELATTTTRLTGLPQSVVFCLRTGKNNRKWLRVNTKKITYNGEDFVIASFIDTTNTYIEHQQVKIKEERWDLALKASDLGVWDIDIKSGEAYFSPELYHMLGYEEGDLEKHINVGQQLMHPDDLEISKRAYSACVSGLSSEYFAEVRFKCKDGTWKWIQSTGKITGYSGNGEAKRIAGTHRDISERKEIEEQLKVSQQKFFSVFNYSAVGMAMLSLEGRWLDVNPALERILGYSREELLKLTFRETTHPDDITIDDDRLARTLSGEYTTYTREKRYFHKKGYLVWVLLTISLVRNDQGEPQFFMSQISDITHLKELITELEGKNYLLNETTSTLENKINQLEEFSRIVAHNLRGPAGNISMLTNLLEAEPENSSMFIDMLKESSGGLIDTLQQLIEILEIRLNTTIEFDECNVESLVAKVKTMFNVTLATEEIAIREELDLPVISYPESYLESILYNLISNSIKYRRAEGKTEIVVRTFEKNGRSVIEVEDNGIGIDLKKYGHQLFKLKKVFHKGYESKGIGLFITKNQIEALKGNIYVSSEPGKGSKFTVEI